MIYVSGFLTTSHPILVPWGPIRVSNSHGSIPSRSLIVDSSWFPLPKREDILQALVGLQWLSTLDALAGFTQLEFDPKECKKLAFRTHGRLWQFIHMHFRYKNGPSNFQRVMQNIPGPFLWIFTLVYIDDTVIFSKTFDDHLNHLDQEFKVVAKMRITLGMTKCHFAYQSYCC